MIIPTESYDAPPDKRMEIVQRLVADKLRAHVSVMTDRTRNNHRPRAIAMSITYDLLGVSDAEVGSWFGRRTSSDSWHVRNNLAKKMSADKKLTALYDRLRAEVQAHLKLHLT